MAGGWDCCENRKSARFDSMSDEENLVTRVLEAMERVGLNKTQLASMMGLDLSKLSKSFSGNRRFTSLELAQIANLTEVTVDWLLTGIERPQLAFAHRAQAGVIAEADREVADLVEKLRERFESLDRLGYRIDVPRFREPSTMWASDQRGREYASYILRELGQSLTHLDLPELIKVVEEKFGVQVVVYPLPDQCDGLSYVEGDFRLIVLGTSNKPFRQRFTLGHELGHILFGDCRHGVIQEQVQFDGQDSTEVEANAFASLLLVPERDIRSFLDGADPIDKFDELVMHFQVSPSAMVIALRKFSMITSAGAEAVRGRRSRQSAMASGQGARYGELAGVASAIRPAWAIVHRLLEAYSDGQITLFPVADVLGWSFEKTEEFFDPPEFNIALVR